MSEFALCPTCRGNGTIVNPAVDGNGLSIDDFDREEPSREDYFGGVYDILCPECRGEKVVPACKCGRPVVEGRYSYLGPTRDEDEERPFSGCYEHLTEDEREWVDSSRETAAIYESERRMGA